MNSYAHSQNFIRILTWPGLLFGPFWIEVHNERVESLKSQIHNRYVWQIPRTWTSGMADCTEWQNGRIIPNMFRLLVKKCI
jgi:hypothetical protein